MSAVVALPLYIRVPSFVHFMDGAGSPVASHCKFTLSPSSVSIVAFDRFVILGGTEKLEETITLKYIYNM